MVIYIYTHILRGNLCLILPNDQVRTIFIHSASSYYLRLTDVVGVLAVPHVHTFTFKRLSVSDVRRSISGGLHMYISSYTKDFVLNFQRYLSLLLMNSETKSIWRQQSHNTHYRETIPQYRLEVCITHVQVVCVVT
jgi:hypothetical protein